MKAIYLQSHIFFQIHTTANPALNFYPSIWYTRKKIKKCIAFWNSNNKKKKQHTNPFLVYLTVCSFFFVVIIFFCRGGLSKKNFIYLIISFICLSFSYLFFLLFSFIILLHSAISLPLFFSFAILPTSTIVQNHEVNIQAVCTNLPVFLSSILVRIKSKKYISIDSKFLYKF